MDNKELLRSARAAGIEIQRLKQIRQVYMDMATSISVSNDSQVHVSDPANSKVAKAAIKMADLSRQITDQIVTNLELIACAVQIIGKVKQPTYRALLTMRYVELRTWKEIQAELGYTEERNMFRAHSAALNLVMTID